MKGRLPPWFQKRMPKPSLYNEMKSLVDGLSLHTICESAVCPNQGDCFSQGTATFLILGDVCTRNCTFCAVQKGIPCPVDEQEPRHLAEATRLLNLKHVVITSVTRDDLPDGGAHHFFEVITALKDNNKELTVEVLIPDFGGCFKSLQAVIGAHPDVVNHNMETVPRLYPEVRPMADFWLSMQLLGQAKELNPGVVTKSGLMLGLGETKLEVLQVMEELRGVGCELLTMGQYLQPTIKHHPVVRYVPPEEFQEYESIGKAMGFCEVASAPLVRSSFNASQLYAKAIAKKVSGKVGKSAKAYDVHS